MRPPRIILEGEWRLDNATVTAPQTQPKRVKIYRLPTKLEPQPGSANL